MNEHHILASKLALVNFTTLLRTTPGSAYESFCTCSTSVDILFDCYALTEYLIKVDVIRRFFIKILNKETKGKINK